MGWLLLAVLAGFIGVAPGLGVAAVFLLLVTLRTIEGVKGGLEERRSRRGPRDIDAVLSVAGSPWHLVSAAVGTLVQLLLPIAAGVAVVGALIAGMSGIPSIPLALGGAVFVVLAFFGPGSGKPRRRAQRTLSAVVRGRTATIVTACGAVLLLLLELSAIDANMLVSWPAQSGWWN